MSVLVGKMAPDFTASAVMPDNTINDKFNFITYTKGKVGILFFWPADFSFVCPSEIIAFNNKLEDFEALGATLVGCSVDSKFVHLAWKNKFSISSRCWWRNSQKIRYFNRRQYSFKRHVFD